jgi:NAD(P)-dependent dehydrogenase (short-subunit alcohol dehydrogenase family)
MIRFDDQVAIVTGAGRGMGREMARLLARRGAKVVVNDYGGDETGLAGDAGPAEAVAAEIRAEGGVAIADTTTVGTSEGADVLLAAALDAFGRVDILINNAGGSTVAPIDALEDARIERVMRTNYWGPYLLIRRAWPHMRAQGYGRILNVSSAGVLGIGHLAPYASGKAALLGLTAEAAIEGAPHDILVNAIFPCGYSRLAAKSQEDMRRWYETWFQPELVANAVAYFVSREMTASGETYSVGGGRVSRIATVNNDGYFERDLTPESLAVNMAQVRDLAGAEPVTSCAEENMRNTRWLPWTGGTLSVF